MVMTILDFQKRKKEKKPISMIVCYDYWSAQIVDQTNIDIAFIGDSIAMVIYGHASTIPASVDMIASHIQAVARGAPNKFILADMPFLSYRKGLKTTMNNVEKLMQAGAHAIKIEGVQGHEKIIKHIVESGVPVMGHLGLTPQSIHALGGFRVQGKNEDAVQTLMSDLNRLQDCGCFASVLECVPAPAAAAIAAKSQIPIIGIGAGAQVDGQVLVLQDLLGINSTFKPKFVKNYLNGFELIKNAVNTYDHEVKSGQFPSSEESYS